MFVVAGRTDEYTYKLQLATLALQEDIGVERITDGVKVLNTNAYGLGDGSVFMLYLPGRAVADLPEEFLEWVRMPNAWDEIPDTLPFYGLYNINEGTGFFSNVAR